MRYYETVYIINPNFEQSRLDNIIKEVEKQIDQFGKVISHNMWGKKKLAYQIDAQKYGTFVLLYFESDNSSRISDFESFMKLNSSVLRAQTLRLNSRPSSTSLANTISADLEDDSDGAIEKTLSKEEASQSIEVDGSAEEEDEAPKEEVGGSAEEEDEAPKEEVDENTEEEREKSDSDSK